MTRSDFLFRILACIPFLRKRNRAMVATVAAGNEVLAPDGTLIAHLGPDDLGDGSRQVLWLSERVKRKAFDAWGR